MKVYITASQAISPQETFLNKVVPENLVVYNGSLKNIGVNFKDYFPPLQSRRINKLIKTSHICAVEAIKQSGIEKPDAIITGSGLGCVESTEKFLNDMLRTNEGILAPTAFIQSTSNAIGAQIALHYKCHGYNVLYAQKSFSFEIALQDAFLRLKDKEEENILLGGFDELTPENCALKQKVGIYKNEAFSSSEILNSITSGSIPGEGATFFVLTNKPTDKALAEIKSIDMRSSKMSIEETRTWIAASLLKQAVDLDEIDLVVCGFNGDKNSDSVYHELLNTAFPNATHTLYKHLCGEYDTATAFATWFATNAIANNNLPEHSIISNKKRPFKHVVIYNQLNSAYHSLTLLSCVENN